MTPNFEARWSRFGVAGDSEGTEQGLLHRSAPLRSESLSASEATALGFSPPSPPQVRCTWVHVGAGAVMAEAVECRAEGQQADGGVGASDEKRREKRRAAPGRLRVLGCRLSVRLSGQTSPSAPFSPPASRASIPVVEGRSAALPLRLVLVTACACVGLPALTALRCVRQASRRPSPWTSTRPLDVERPRGPRPAAAPALGPAQVLHATSLEPLHARICLGLRLTPTVRPLF